MRFPQTNATGIGGASALSNSDSLTSPLGGAGDLNINSNNNNNNNTNTRRLSAFSVGSSDEVERLLANPSGDFLGQIPAVASHSGSSLLRRGTPPLSGGGPSANARAGLLMPAVGNAPSNSASRRNSQGGLPREASTNSLSSQQHAGGSRQSPVTHPRNSSPPAASASPPKQFDVHKYFRELSQIVPPLTEKLIEREDAIQRNATRGMLAGGGGGGGGGAASVAVAANASDDVPLSSADKRTVRELLYHHACVVEALSAQLPVDVDISADVLRSTADNAADAALLRVDFLSGARSALVAMRVLTHLAVLGGQGWRERQRAAALRDAERSNDALRAEAASLRAQLGEAHKEIAALQSVVNETRVQSHRQLMESEMRRRELHEEMSRQQKQHKALVLQIQHQNQQQHQGSHGNVSGTGGAHRTAPSPAVRMMLSSQQQPHHHHNNNNHASNGTMDPFFGAFDVSMNDEALLFGGSVPESPSDQQQQHHQERGAALMRGVRDAWGGSFAAHASAHKKSREQQQQQQESAFKQNKFLGREERITRNTKYGVARPDAAGDAGGGGGGDATTEEGKDGASPLSAGSAPARWLMAQQNDERLAEVRRKAASFNNGGGGDRRAPSHVTPPPPSSPQSQSSAGAGATVSSNRRRSLVTFEADTSGSAALGAAGSTSPSNLHQQRRGGGAGGGAGGGGKNAVFLAGVKDMLATLVPERQRLGVAEEDALADLEEAEIVHGHVSDITGEAPSSDLKVIRNFSGKGNASVMSKQQLHMLRKRELFGAGHADAIPPVLFKRPPQVPDAAFIESVFRALQSLQVGSFHGQDDLSPDAVVEPGQVVEYLNTHWPQLDDLLGSVDAGGVGGRGAKGSKQTPAVVEFVERHVPLHRKSFAQVLLHVSGL